MANMRPVFLLREPGKTGGTKYYSAEEAATAHKQWLADTGIYCEIWLTCELIS